MGAEDDDLLLWPNCVALAENGGGRGHVAWVVSGLLKLGEFLLQVVVFFLHLHVKLRGLVAEGWGGEGGGGE
jgi:hypothetical protein